MHKKMNLFFRLISLLYLSISVQAICLGQSVSNEILKDVQRNQQLLGNDFYKQSFSVNSNQIQLNDDGDSILDKSAFYKGKSWSLRKKIFSFELLPVVVTQLYNSALPYEWNLGGMIPAKGYQIAARTGVYARIGKHITVQLAPEIVYADNKEFEQFSQQLSNDNWASYYRFLNTSDIPTRLGNSSYSKILPGQSSIRYHFRSFSTGISTESLWWGPGWKNSLIMSTNAPGFLHATFNTIKPIQTRIGSFEGQVIAGKLEESGILPPRIYSSFNGSFLYQPKNQEWRYITGMVVSWQPKWVKHLYLGIAKASYLYHSDISNPLDVLPLQGFMGRVRTASERNGKKASMGSLFARYIMPGDHAEIYMEYGRKDISLMPWNILQTDAYRRAYVAGVRKLFPTRNKANILFTAEFTQMQAPTAELILDPDSWYTHRYVRQGYTHSGRSIGAGIGPGSNSQSFEISWVKGLKKIGLEFERVRYNSDFYYYAFASTLDFRRHWINLSGMAKVNWDFKKVYTFAQFGVVRSYNYQWLIIQVDPNNFFAPGNEILNWTGKIGVIYKL